MSKDEALKLALEALYALAAMNHTTQQMKSNAINAIKEALAQPEQEPVAIKHMKEWVEYLKRKSDHGQHMQIPSEMSAGACWELAIELEQFINTTPPQRTWVGLSDAEIIDAWHWGGTDPHIEGAHFTVLYKYFETKLKDKNHV